MAKKPTNPDYIEHGSERHAALLGLVKAGEDDEPQHEGWALADVTMYGAAARPEFLLQTLKQKVSELTTPPPVMQSEDPLAPNYAPPMWMPDGEPVSGIV
jgi:hypothetical protein